MNKLFLQKVFRVLRRKADAAIGSLYPLQKTLDAMAARPFELHLELTNICNSHCVFCPYQFQERPAQIMPDRVFKKAVSDFVSIGGGSVGLTPIVGDALVDKQFLERVRYLRSLPEIDRIWLTTNAILLDKHGIAEVLDAGLSSINISTAGFEEEMYKRVYRNSNYKRMLRNVTALLEKNSKRPLPIPITISLRPDRPLDEIMRDRDFQNILAFKPALDFTWSFTTAIGRITKDILPSNMKLRSLTPHDEPCVELFNGPIVLPEGEVMICCNVAAMDAIGDLSIGNILETSLLDIWSGDKARRLRNSFLNGQLNDTCARCDMYRNLELYRTSEGRRRAALNRRRMDGEIVRREDVPAGSFSGG